VVRGSTIWTDEHASYRRLGEHGYEHDTVVHKYHFINPVTAAHTQNVESFNNSLKLEIKRRKGIKTENRQCFLDEFTLLFNNKNNRIDKIKDIIKLIT
jgi:hypothetical protein